MRYDSSTTSSNTVDGTILYSHDLQSWLQGEFGGRLAISNIGLDRLDGKAEAILPLLDFFAPHLRLTHSYSFEDSTTATTILRRVSCMPFPSLFSAFS